MDDDDFDVLNSINVKELEFEIIELCKSDYAVEKPDF